MSETSEGEPGEPRLLVALQEVFLHVILHLDISSALRCAVTSQTRAWLDDAGFWETQTRRLCVYRLPSLGLHWRDVFKEHWKKGFYQSLDNVHASEPRIKLANLSLIIDDVPTMELPHPFHTSAFFLSPLDGGASFELHSEKIAEALNSGDMEYLQKEELHKHIGQILPSNPFYNVAFREVYPHWFDSDDPDNYFLNQHVKFGFDQWGNRSCPFPQGFYQAFWEDPVWKDSEPLIWSDSKEMSPLRTPHVMFDLIIPLQARSKLDKSRVDFYKQQILSGITPTVLSLGIVDDRRTPLFIGGDHPFPKYYRKFSHITTLVSWILDGHHKLEAAAQLNSRVRFLQFINRDQYGCNLNYEDHKPEPMKGLFDLLVSKTSPRRELCQTTVAYPMPNVDLNAHDFVTPRSGFPTFPPLLLFRLSGSRFDGGKKKERTQLVAETVKNILCSSYLRLLSKPKLNQLANEQFDRMSQFITHFECDGSSCYVWTSQYLSFLALFDFGIAVHPESVAEGFMIAPPELPDEEYYDPGSDCDADYDLWEDEDEEEEEFFRKKGRK